MTWHSPSHPPHPAFAPKCSIYPSRPQHNTTPHHTTTIPVDHLTPPPRERNIHTKREKVKRKLFSLFYKQVQLLCYKMLENIGSAIKLFGKTIRLGSNPYGDAVIASRIEASADYHDGHDCTTSDGNLFCSKQGKNCGTEICSRGEPTDDSQGGESSSISTLEVSKTQSTTTENPKTLSDEKDCSSQDHAQKEDHSDQTSSNQSEAQNPPKKPDEILPCPRCKSMDTKFCYFNNYNLNQPRHFCKNCQRYWTAGGTMRNVPVGSGRRKNKNSFLSGSQPSHIVIHEAPSGLTHQAMMPDMRVFGSQSSASSLNRGGNSSSSSLDGLVRPKMRIPAPCGLSGNQGIEASKGLIPPQMACFPGSPWPYAWNPIPWQSGCPLPFYVAPPQWICNPPAQPWNLHLLPNPSTCPDPNSSLGKRSRDGSMLVPSNFTNKKLAKEQRSDNQTPQVLMPKTLRIIDDPIEVARSSVCGSLAMQKDKGRSSNIGGQIFGGFHPYKDVNPQRVNATAEGSHIVTQTNPAAFSRSLSFHEIGQ